MGLSAENHHLGEQSKIHRNDSRPATQIYFLFNSTIWLHIISVVLSQLNCSACWKPCCIREDLRSSRRISCIAEAMDAGSSGLNKTAPGPRHFRQRKAIRADHRNPHFNASKHRHPESSRGRKELQRMMLHRSGVITRQTRYDPENGSLIGIPIHDMPRQSLVSARRDDR